MLSDEQSIRDVIARWHRASAGGDVDCVLSLMTEDVVFLVAGHPPMRGRAAFEKGLREVIKTHDLTSTGDVQEVRVSGDLAYAWSVLEVGMTPKAGGETSTRSGNVLSVFARQPDGSWQLMRDANLLAPAS